MHLSATPQWSDSSLEAPWREDAERLRYAPLLWSCTGYYGGLTTALFQQDNAQPHVARIVQRFFVNHQIELLPWLARSPDLSPIENMWSMVAQRLTQITPPAEKTRSTLATCESCFWSAVPQEHIQSLHIRGVWQRGFPTMAATLDTNSVRNPTSQKSLNLII
ncbi:transposable element Tcb1 transposase [Trichonephila clavipes]|nr:transposable element Tcb1 transposase [Trichonephila clavipes]